MQRTQKSKETKSLSGWRLGQPKVEESMSLPMSWYPPACNGVSANFFKEFHAETLQEALEKMLTKDVTGTPIHYWVYPFGGRTGYHWEVRWPLFRRGRDSAIVSRQGDTNPATEPEDPPEAFWPGIQLKLKTCHPSLEDLENNEAAAGSLPWHDVEGEETPDTSSAGEQWKGDGGEGTRSENVDPATQNEHDFILELSYSYRGEFRVGTLMLATGGVTREEAVRNWHAASKVLRLRVRAIRKRVSPE